MVRTAGPFFLVPSSAFHFVLEGDADWKYAFAHEGRLLHHGDRITIGNVHLDLRHTPGHTPGYLSFLITDGAAADRPIAAATGDFIFVGDVGRPDLLERAAHLAGTMEQGARTLWRSLRTFDREAEWLQIWPGHGAGSACGKGISAIPYSTLGYERRFNWAFAVPTEDAFVAKVLEGQPEPPAYFAMMKTLNQRGPRRRRRSSARHAQYPVRRVVRHLGGLAAALHRRPLLHRRP